VVMSATLGESKSENEGEMTVRCQKSEFVRPPHLQNFRYQILWTRDWALWLMGWTPYCSPKLTCHGVDGPPKLVSH
jgi:hypothetical protein